MMTRSILLIARHVLALALSVTPAGALWAHIPQYGVGTVCEVKFREDRLHLVYDLSYDGIWAQAEMLGMDRNKSSTVDKDEADLYLERQWSERISRRVRVLVDGREASVRKTGGRYEGLEGEIFGVPFSLFYDLEIELPGGRCEPGRWYALEIHDTVVKDETPAKPAYHVPYEGHGDGSSRFRCDFPKPQLAILEATSYVVQGDVVQIRFLFEAIGAQPLDPTRGGVPDGEATPGEPSRGAAETDPVRREAQDESEGGRGDSEYSKKLEESVRKFDELGWGAIFALFFLALAWGAGHALTPGHGKSMVAAYLIGTKGRVRDAVILGLTTTITHTGSVFLFGGGVYLLINASTVAASAGHLQNLIVVGTQLASGLMLVVMGLVLFFRRVGGAPPGHDPPHGHDHGHSHSHGHGHVHGHDRSHRHEQGHSHSHGHGHGLGSAHEHVHTHEDKHSDSHEHAGDPRRAHEHEHEHEHEHADEDAPAGLLRGGTPRLWDLLALGFSGGVVPCPAGLTVIIIGLQYPHKLAFTLLLLVFFSIGLGAVLVAIGVLLITGKALAGSRVQGGGFFQQLEFLRRVFPRSFLAAMDRQGMKVLRLVPAASCLFIAGLGAFFLVRTSIAGKTEIIAMLRLVADWLE